MQGDRVEDYRLLRLLGKGGMGAVYLAFDEAAGTHVALKVSLSGLGDLGASRLAREADLLRRARSPYLPRFLDYFPHDERHVLVMEFIEGRPLSAEVRETHDAASRLALVERAAPGLSGGLRELHRLGIVHRDIKTDNVLIASVGDGDAPVGRAVLVDLGGAWAPDVATLTRTGALVGTPRYFTPEMIVGEELTPASDVYQLALVIWDLLVGRPKMDMAAALQDAMERTVRRFDDPREASPWIPDPLAEWLDQALHPDPQMRPDAGVHLTRLVTVTRDLRPDDRAAAAAASAPDPSRTYDRVAAMRKDARAQGWTEDIEIPESLVASLDRTTEPLPSSAPDESAAAPRVSTVEAASRGLEAPRGRGFPVGVVAGLAVALLAGTLSGLLVPMGGVPGTTRGEVAFRLDDEGLWLEGASAATLRDPAGEFVATESGRVRAAAEVGDLRGRVVTAAVDGREVPLPLLALGPTTGWSPVAGTPGGIRFELPGDREVEVEVAGGAGRVGARGRGRVELPLPPGWAREAGALLVSAKVPGGLPVLQEIPLRDWARIRLDALRPPEVSLGKHLAFLERRQGKLGERELLGDAFVDFLKARGSELAALLAWPGIGETRRYGLYARFEKARQVEWTWRHAPRQFRGRIEEALGEPLGLAEGPTLTASRPGEEIQVSTHAPGVRLGPESGFQSLFRGDATGGRDEEGRYHAFLTGLPAAPPEALELGMHIHGSLNGGALRVELPGARVLHVPVAGTDCWRYHRLPPAWLWEGRDPEGRVELIFDFARGEGFRIPGKLNVDLLVLRSRASPGP